MPHDRRTDTAAIFAEAIERPATERNAFIDGACDGDDGLARRVRRLVASHERAAAVLPDPGSLDLSSHAVAAIELLDGEADAGEIASKLIGRTIDGFRIVRVLGAGGMGAVFEAEQEHPARSVALKILRLGVTSRAMLRRFEFEAEVLGRLRHPGIAQIHHAGTFDDGTGGVPYFAMEYVPDARDIVRFAEERDLDAPAKLDLFARVCDAVHHGHQRGIVHRDLKPANILIDPAGQPKIIDFGVARATDNDLAVSTLHTQAGALVGTILYMSPEQVEGDPDEIDTRSDVYSLGVILYELLAGRLPFDLERRSLAESARRIREQSPARLSAVRREFRGDIQTIVEKCLEKEPERRYQSAAELAEDIRRHRRSEPISAAPPSARYRAGRFIRRNPVLVGAAAIVTVALVVGFAVATWGWFEAAAANRRSTAEAQRRQRALDFVVGLLRTPSPGVEGADARIVDALGEAEARIGAAFEGDPALELSIRNVLGEVLFDLGMYDEAETHYRRALALSEDLHGAVSEETAAALGGRGVTLSHLGRLEEAEETLRKALAVRERAGAPPDDDHALLLSQLASTLDLQGRIDEAESTFRRAEDMSGEDSEARMEILAGLGVIAFRRRQLDSAIERSERAYELAVRRNGMAHRDTIALIGNIAFFRGLQGDSDGELEVYRRALATARDELGETHPLLAQLLVNYGDALDKAGAREQAGDAYEEAIYIRRLRLGDAHIATAQARYKLAYVLRSSELARSADMLRSIVAPFRREYGPDAWETRLLLLNLGRTVGNLGDHVESESHFREAYEATKRAGRDDQVRMFLGDYVDARLRNHRFDEETERLCREFNDVVSDGASNDETTVNPRPHQLFVLLCRRLRFGEAIDEAEAAIAAAAEAGLDDTAWRVNLGMAQLDAGRLEDAMRAAAELRDRRPSDALLASRVLGFRGAVCLAEGNAAEAEGLLREALSRRAASHRLQVVPTLGRVESDLGVVLMRLEHREEAEPLLREGADHIARAWGDDDWLAVRARQRLETPAPKPVP